MRGRPGNTGDIWISLEVDAPTIGTQLSLVTLISHHLGGWGRRTTYEFKVNFSYIARPCLVILLYDSFVCFYV